jgi:hypothetical protein
VPRSTIHYGSRHGLLAPAVSPERVKLWSYADLMGLRIIYWLRQRKTDAKGADIPPTSMKAIRKALDRLRELDEPLWDHEASVWVDANGDLHLKGPAGPETLAGQTLVADAIDLIAPFSTRRGSAGPTSFAHGRSSASFLAACRAPPTSCTRGSRRARSTRSVATGSTSRLSGRSIRT